MKRMLNPLKMTFLSGIVLGALLLFSAGMVQAQDDEGRKKGKISGGYGYFSTGYTNLDMGPLNNFLGNGSFADLSNDQFLLGGGGFMIVRNLVLGGEGHSLVQQKINNGVQNISLAGGWGQFQIGYVVLSHKGLLVYPRLGVGGYNHRMQVVKTGAAGTNVNSLVGTSTTTGTFTGTEIARTGLLLSGEIGIDFMPGFDETSGSGATIGLNIGYNYAATSNAWTAYEAELAGGPDLDMTGIYAKLTVGFGGWHRQ